MINDLWFCAIIEVKNKLRTNNKRQRKYNTEMPERIRMSSFDGIPPRVQRFRGSVRPTVI